MLGNPTAQVCFEVNFPRVWESFWFSGWAIEAKLLLFVHDLDIVRYLLGQV